jgi:hypothetical protein
MDNSRQHIAGHMGALARVTPTNFILFAGDAFHQAGQIRPSPHLSTSFPVPANILDASRHSISHEYFFAPDDDTDLHNRTIPFLAVATGAESFYQDPVTSRISQFMLGVFDSDEDVLVLTAHDASMHDFLEFFPNTLNEWQKKGVKDRGVWNFANASSTGYRLTALDNSMASVRGGLSQVAFSMPVAI